MDRFVEDIRISERLVGEIVSLKIMPDDLDVVEFGCIFGQPPGGEPMGALGKGRQGGLARMDRAVVEHDDSRLDLRTGLWTIETIENLQMRNEVGAALGWRGGNDQLALLLDHFLRSLAAIDRGEDRFGQCIRRRIQRVRIALGGVGTTPWRLIDAERRLTGMPATPDSYQQIAAAALKDARPLSQNGFKVALAQLCLVHALRQATETV